LITDTDDPALNTHLTQLLYCLSYEEY
jgi:hypothetical protein